MVCMVELGLVIGPVEGDQHITIVCSEIALLHQQWLKQPTTLESTAVHYFTLLILGLGMS